ncbi:U6 snRNA-associated Sm-like protein LSm2 [Kwoniella mangroviensis CBS 8886]|nr:U6 snRNA-associated Sm-like protein LSm2 [Kwoniella mangroviensis CBS 8886]
MITGRISLLTCIPELYRFLNIRLDGISVEDPERHPHMLAVKNCFIRGSVVRYVRMAARSVDTTLLEDATRREAKEAKK